jgi:hypothetical protein
LVGKIAVGPRFGEPGGFRMVSHPLRVGGAAPTHILPIEQALNPSPFHCPSTPTLLGGRLFRGTRRRLNPWRNSVSVRELPVLHCAGEPTAMHAGLTASYAVRNARTRRLIMSCIRGEFFWSPAAIPSTDAEATCQTWPAPISPPSPISPHGAGGRSFPQDQQQPQRFRRVCSSGWRSRGPG